MNGERLMDCLGDIDEHYVKEAAPGNRPAKRRWLPLAGAAAAVLIVAAAVGGPRSWKGSPAEGPGTGPESSASEKVVSETLDPGESAGGSIVGDAPGYIRWRGHNYFHHGHAVHEMPEGLEFLGEVNLGVEEGGLLPEDAADLSANFGDGGSAYMFPGNDSLIVFRYKEWNAEEEMGREEPILLMFREFDEEGPHQPGQPYYTLSDLMKDSDVIVEGTAVRLEGADLIGGGNVLYTVQVADVLQGRVETETIRIRVPEGSDVLEASGEGHCLLFLQRETDGNFRPVFPSQGAYPIKGKFLHVPANDPCRMTAFPILHTEDGTFWYGMNHVREWIQGGQQGAEPVT